MSTMATQPITHDDIPAVPAPVETEAAAESTAPAGLRGLMRLRDFRLLWLGEMISLVGDQFHMIALPWLVLQLTGDALAVGTVLALGGIPRAGFVLVGGAMTDRFSPRSVMLASNIVRMGLVGLLAALVWTGSIEVWMLYAIALAFGLADAFFFPASSAIVPRVVGLKHLEGANALIQGTMQISLFAGPLLAGLLIALVGGSAETVAGESVPDTRGIALAFGVDALTFLVSAFTLFLMRTRRPQNAGDAAAAPREGVISAIRAGLVYVWADVKLRTFFILIGVSNLLINGPLIVGIPVLADTRFAEGAAAFGIIMSAYGGGSLVGTLLAATLPRPPAARMGILLGVIWSGMGMGIFGLGLVNSTALAALVALAMGIANGYVVILFVTWLQRRTPDALLGRIMSLLMFASVGLQPVSMALTGALIDLNTTALFAGSGALMTVLTFLFFRNPAIHAMEDTPIAEVAA